MTHILLAPCRFSLFRIMSPVFCAGLLIAGTHTAAKADEAVELARRLPANINAIAIVRMQDALQTPRAQQEEWAKKADERFLNEAGGIPSWVQTLVMGSLVHPENQEEVWSALVLRVPKEVTVTSISQRDNVPEDRFDELPAVRSRRNSYILGIEPGMLGIWRPATRQAAVHWARNLMTKATGPLSEYLADVPQTPGHLVMAIDLQDTLDPVRVRSHLDELMLSEEKTGTKEDFLKLLLSLRGLTLAARIDQQTTARMQIDFQKDVGPFGKNIQTVFVDVLNQMGAAIDEFQQAELQTQGNSVILQTQLSDESMRRLMSLITMPPSSSNSNSRPLATAPTLAFPPLASGDAKASKKYYRQVDEYLRNLEKSNRRANDISRTAMWHQQFATKIDSLSTEGVDPALVRFGRDVASKLRALSRSLQGQAIEVNIQQGTLTYDYDYQPGWASVNVWGGVGYGEPAYNVNSNLQQVREKQAAAVVAGSKQRLDIWGMIADEQAQVLRQMQDQFGKNFPK